MQDWLGWSTKELTALGAVLGGTAAALTFVVAAIAAVVAYVHVREAKKLRMAQTQPYVVVYFAISPASTMHLDLIVKNIGQTAARNVQISFDPPLTSTLDERKFKRSDAHFLAGGIPTLPPGMEYRMLFEDGVKLHDEIDRPRMYTAFVRFESQIGPPSSAEFVLDLNTFYGFESLVLYGEHHSAAALRKISATIDKWTTHGNGMHVYMTDEDKLQQQWAQRSEQRRNKKIQSQEDVDDAQASEVTTTKTESMESNFQPDI